MRTEKEELDDYLADLREKLHFSDDPEYLARYIELGGDLGQDLRTYLANLVRERAPKPRGKKDGLRDVDFCMRVDDWIFSEHMRRCIRAANPDGTKTPEETFRDLHGAGIEEPSVEEALRHLIEHRPDYVCEVLSKQHTDDIEIGSMRRVYERGRKLLGPLARRPS